MNKILLALIAALMSMNLMAAKKCGGHGGGHHYHSNCASHRYRTGHNCGPSYHRWAPGPSYYHKMAVRHGYYCGSYAYRPVYPGCYYYDYGYTDPVVVPQETIIMNNSTPAVNVIQQPTQVQVNTTVVTGDSALMYDRDGQPIKETKEIYWVPGHYESHVSNDGRQTEVYVPGQYVHK